MIQKKALRAERENKKATENEKIKAALLNPTEHETEHVTSTKYEHHIQGVRLDDR